MFSGVDVEAPSLRTGEEKRMLGLAAGSFLSLLRGSGSPPTGPVLIIIIPRLLLSPDAASALS